MSTAKGYAKNVLDGYNDTLVRLAQRYTSAVSTIDKEHDARNSEIKREAQRRKNSADASNKAALKNTQRALVDKGLSRSGTSVQAEIDTNLARNTALSNLESDASRERSENETARARSKSSALAEFVDSINAVETKKNEAYIAQLNADRAYEAERDDEKHDRYVENRAYEAERDDEKHDRYVENRAYEAERDDEKHDRYVENRAYEAERDDERFDRYAENRAYEADRSDEEYDRYADERDHEAERDDEMYDRVVDKRDYDAERADELYDRGVANSDAKGENSDGTLSPEDDGIVLDVAPKTLVEKLKGHYEVKYYGSDKGASEIRKALDTIIEDETLSYTYRYQVKVYAVALGLY